MTSYKGSVNCNAAFNTVFAAGSAATRALLFISALACALSCADNDPPQGSPGAEGGASTGGMGESPGAVAGEGGSSTAGSGESGQGGDSVDGAGSGAGGSGATAAGGHTRAPAPGDVCIDDSDCDDGVYCNGPELCKTLPGTDVKVCMGPEHGPCYPSECSELTHCNCADADRDGDTFKIGPCAGDQPADCDDNDGARNPAAVEVCDNQMHDEDCNDLTFGALDADHDQFSDASCANKLRYQPLFFTPEKPLTASGSDCDDHQSLVHPGALEICDNLDNNCNEQVDELAGGVGTHTFFRDRDGDLWGDTNDTVDTLCDFSPPGYAVFGGDCDDRNPLISPAREEICNGADDDCDLEHTIDQPQKPGQLMFGEPYDGVTQFECTGKAGWKVKQCPDGRMDCDGKYLDACETIATTICNCHKCGRVCAFSCGETDCEEITTVSAGEEHTCAIAQPPGSTAGGPVACWGRNFRGQLGNGSTKDSPRAIRIPDLENITAIASGQRHTCAMRSDGKLLCWGDNEFGQLGSGPARQLVPFPVEVSPPPSLVQAKWLRAGAFHTCAIFDEGRPACWGQGDLGQLGNNATSNADSPVRVQRIVSGVSTYIRDASRVVAGYEHSCLLSAGRVECWGDNSSQQLGVDPEMLDSSSTAIIVAGLDGLHVDELSASAYHTCARAGADVYCWGSNSDHELALESGDYGPPTKIPLPVAAVAITTGSFFGCALGPNETAYCWGSNDAGELGSNHNPSSVLPSAIPLAHVRGIFGGGIGEHVCASTLSDGTWCWGDNSLGQLGNGNTSSSPQPVPSRILPLSGAQACFAP